MQSIKYLEKEPLSLPSHEKIGEAKVCRTKIRKKNPNSISKMCEVPTQPVENVLCLMISF